jgi:glucose/arabinose dehydrogenase
MCVALAPLAAAADQAGAGRFGKALVVGEQYAAAKANPIYFVVPMTVECWARVGANGVPQAKSRPTILLANEPRHSQTHWEIYTQKDTGALAASMPGWDVKELVSTRDVVDGKWHHLAMVLDGKALRLYVDGQEVATKDAKKVAPYPDTGPLTFGSIPGVESNSDVLIDEVRLSRVARPMTKAPDAPFAPDADTVGLWHFDETGDAFADASLTRNPAHLAKIGQQAPGGGFDGSILVGGRTRWADMDFGPFFSSTLNIPSQKDNVTHKAVSIRLDDKHAIAFDTELLRVSAAWEGDFLKIHPFREGLGGPPDVAGSVQFSTLAATGWSGSRAFDDPRSDKLGPLPREHGRFNGLHVHGSDVVLSYRVRGADVLELHGVETLTLRGLGRPAVSQERTFFTRTIEVSPHTEPIVAAVCDEPGATQSKVGAADKGEGVQLRIGDEVACAGIVPVVPGVKWEVVNGSKLLLWFAPSPVVQRVKVVLWRRGADETPALATFSPARNLAALTTGGPARFPEPVVTKGVLGSGAGPYAVDTLTAPVDNPWKSFLRFGGHDFFKNGDAALCSVSGDVWVVSGIDEKLEKLTWRRFATGLFQPLGLRIVDDKVYVLGRDQITRLHDLNNDGEADFYENFNNDVKVTANGHAYATNLETDPAGNFYFTKCADGTEHGGALLRVSKDGSKLDVFATGLRNPNGMGVSPTGEVTEADNQGEWVPASRLDVVEQGEFLGYQPMSKRNPPPTDPGKPLCWMPQNVDNSSGGQTWVAGDRWGPFKDAMLHTSYGGASLLLVLQETVDGMAQGGVVRFPLTFDSGVMRARFRPQDGQLYVSGLRGWQTAGIKDAAFQRVRYTGKPVYMPAALNVHGNGIRLSFTCPLEPDLANNPDSYSVLRWNYRWTGEYGSRQWSLTNPQQQGYDTMKVKSAKLLPDGKSVFLEVEDMRPVMQMQIGYDLEAADGTQVRGEIYNTIHALRPPELPAAGDR